MDVFRLLEKTNCRKCNEKTCLAFASKVFLGQKTLDLCPFINQEILGQYQEQQSKTNGIETEFTLFDLKNEIKKCNLELSAKRVGGIFSNDRLTIKIFGKPFSIASNGKMFSDIHINSFIAAPILEYVLHCKGVPLTNKWISFRELQGGQEMNGLFVKTSEEPLKKIADRYPSLFEDLMVIFNGKKIENGYESDISLVLYPLPRLPIRISYWKPEDGMSSDLRIFFDSSADMNAKLNVVYRLSAGIVRMFEKISKKHGIPESVVA
ncbi:DUF3786 domain-containing protein [Desulfocicer vacuolatum]|nr:DUF3786 domain-containing protein [Desulfocicer vacuolatum]